jgi:hypothetical protein
MRNSLEDLSRMYKMWEDCSLLDRLAIILRVLRRYSPQLLTAGTIAALGTAVKTEKNDLVQNLNSPSTVVEWVARLDIPTTDATIAGANLTLIRTDLHRTLRFSAGLGEYWQYWGAVSFDLPPIPESED